MGSRFFGVSKLFFKLLGNILEALFPYFCHIHAGSVQVKLAGIYV